MLPHSICKISGYANVELFPFFDNIDPPGIQICPLKVVKPEYIESPPEQEGFLYNGSPGRTRTADQVVTSALIFLPGLDYLITRPENWAEGVGRFPSDFSRRVRAEALVSAPSLNCDNSGLGSGLPCSA